MPTGLGGAVVVAALLGAGGGAEPTENDVPEHFAFLAPLVGHTWEGAFENRDATDTQTLEWVYGRQFIRATHEVTSDGPPYRGEAIYAWDPAKEKTVYWYWTNMGFFTQGTLWQEDGVIKSRESLPSGAVIVGETVIHDAGSWQSTAWRETSEGREHMMTINYAKTR
jgi:hypothetical protein